VKRWQAARQALQARARWNQQQKRIQGGENHVSAQFLDEGDGRIGPLCVCPAVFSWRRLQSGLPEKPRLRRMASRLDSERGANSRGKKPISRCIH
jgi:hypothetical protein